MVQQRKEECICCGADIYYCSGQTLIKCEKCGHTLQITQFESELNRMKDALEEGQQTRRKLETATKERDEFLKKLQEVLKDLGETEESQIRADQEYQHITGFLSENEEIQSAVTTLMQEIRQKKSDRNDTFAEYLRSLMAGQEDVSAILSFLQETAERIHASQKNEQQRGQVLGDMLAKIYTMQVDMQKKQQLTFNLMGWMQQLGEEDLDRVIKIGEASRTIADRLQSIVEKVDVLQDTEDETQKIAGEFHDRHVRERLEEVNYLYHQGQEEQKSRNFEEAENYYREVAQKGGGEAEVYWRILLCHYCIEYQKDEDGQYVPTILNPDLKDPEQITQRKNLLQAVSKQDGTEHYLKELAQIDKILERYREVRWNNACDVFICVKQDIDGNYTTDSNTGAKLYHFLTRKGLKVFNSRETPPPAGDYYEPYIIAALKSAKAMIVVGSSKENLEARWVKNEWSRYQWLQRRGDTDKKLIVYLTGGMQPDQLPRALDPGRQAILDGVKATEQLEAALKDLIEQKQTGDSSGDVSTVLKQMSIWLKLGRFDRVSQKYQELIEKGNYHDHLEIHLSEICAKQQIKSISQLMESDLDLPSQPAYQFVVKNCKNRKLQEQLQEFHWKNEDWKLRQAGERFARQAGLRPQSQTEWFDMARKEYNAHNYPAAAAYFFRAAETGHAKSQVNIGYMYEMGEGIAKDIEHAVFWYQKSAQQGNAVAQANLGSSCERGKGIEKDLEKAFYWYKKAAEQGYDRSQYDLGRCYEFSYGVEQDYSQAVYWYQKAADQGYLDAIANLAWFYRYGKSVEKDENKAFRLYLRAAEKGQLRAQRLLASCYSSGVGTEKDEEKAVYWYQKAAERGDREAQNTLGLKFEKGQGVSKDDVMATYWYHKSARQGYSYGQYNLAWNYAKGRGTEKDEKQAAFWFLKAAEQGHKSAQRDIARRYEEGNGIEKDLEKAYYWYKKAAEQGDSEAQCDLGICYEYGYGTEKDLAKAVYWYQKAAEKGLPRAQCNLGVCYKNGIGTQIDPDQAVRWFQKAADQKDARAWSLLAACYRDGFGVTKDITKAFELFMKAAEDGRSFSQFKLAQMYEEGSGTEIDLNQAVYWYQKAADQGNKKAAQALERLKS